jgi:hypothetical protein
LGLVSGAGNKKPTTVASRGFLLKLFLLSTSSPGFAYYGDYQCYYLSNCCVHYESKISRPDAAVKQDLPNSLAIHWRLRNFRRINPLISPR